MQTAEQREYLQSFRWGQLAITMLLVLIGALCMLKYLGCASVVSGYYGLPSQAEKVASAQRWGLMFFWAWLLDECILITNLIINLRFDNTELSGLPKAVARVLSALLIAAIGTMGTAFLLSSVGRMLH
jgi:phosphoglycerol transferase MdoB-like AlkP superfamily enzyme